MENNQKTAFAEQQRKIGKIMCILMGVSLSFFLSLIGLLSSGHFEIKAWILSFVLSTALSFLIGFCLPVRKTSLAVCTSLGLKERTLPFHCMDSLISDIFYTPLITLLMVALAFMGAKRGIAEAVSHGAPADSLPQIQFLPMFLHGLLISMIAGFVLIFVLQPLFLKILLRKNLKKSAD